MFMYRVPAPCLYVYYLTMTECDLSEGVMRGAYYYMDNSVYWNDADVHVIHSPSKSYFLR